MAEVVSPPLVQYVRWPRYASPGDQLFVPGAIVVSPHPRTLVVEFMFAQGVFVRFPGSRDKNRVRLKPASTVCSIDALFVFDREVSAGNVYSVVVTVYERQLIWWRGLLGCMLLCLVVLPSILKAGRGLRDVVNVTAEDTVLISLPIFIVIATILIWKEALHVALSLLSDERLVENVVTAPPAAAGEIEIRNATDCVRSIVLWKSATIA